MFFKFPCAISRQRKLQIAQRRPRRPIDETFEQLELSLDPVLTEDLVKEDQEVIDVAQAN